MTEDRVGFVVIGRNEGERLARCLDAVRAQSERVIYVDSASSDGSPALARKLGAFVVELRADGSMLSAARGRNAGRTALLERFPGCRYVQFVDGDCILAPHWVETAVEFLEANPNCAAVCGRRYEAHPERSVYNRILDEEWNTPVGRADACGGDAMMRLAALEEVGGFRSDLAAGEEPELCARLCTAGWEIWRLDHPMTEHDAAMLHLHQWWRRAWRSGQGYVQAGKATASLSRQLYVKPLVSALLWALVLPVTVAAAAFVLREPWLLLLIPIGWAAQTARMALRGTSGTAFDWQHALLRMIAKPAEVLGALSSLFAPGRKQLVEYKRTSAMRGPA